MQIYKTYYKVLLKKSSFFTVFGIDERKSFFVSLILSSNFEEMFSVELEDFN